MSASLRTRRRMRTPMLRNTIKPFSAADAIDVLGTANYWSLNEFLRTRPTMSRLAQWLGERGFRIATEEK